MSTLFLNNFYIIFGEFSTGFRCAINFRFCNFGGTKVWKKFNEFFVKFLIDFLSNFKKCKTNFCVIVCGPMHFWRTNFCNEFWLVGLTKNKTRSNKTKCDFEMKLKKYDKRTNVCGATWCFFGHKLFARRTNIIKNIVQGKRCKKCV